MITVSIKKNTCNTQTSHQPFDQCPIVKKYLLQKTELPEIDDVNQNSRATTDEDEETDLFKVSGEDCKKPSLFSQSELNDMVRDLNFPKQFAELLASRLQKKRLLKPGTSLLLSQQRRATAKVLSFI